jgi:predicted O-methyltransferase YrrM
MNTFLTESLHTYMLDTSLREHPVLAALREHTAHLTLASMQVAPELGQLLQFLIYITRSKKILELGTFTGYSALAMALALPADGELITCDINPEWTHHALLFWQQAQIAHKITQRLQPALDTLNELISAGEAHSFDLIFIDADKTHYCEYYELALKLVSPSGLIVIDNIFWNGEVINPDNMRGQTREIRKLNARIKQDSRVQVSLLPIADGVFLIRPN